MTEHKHTSSDNKKHPQGEQQDIEQIRANALTLIEEMPMMPDLELDAVRDDKSTKSWLTRFLDRAEALNAKGHAFHADPDLEPADDVEAHTTDPLGDRQIDPNEEPDDPLEASTVTSDGILISTPPKGHTVDLEKGGSNKSGPLAFRITELSEAPQYGRTSIGADSWWAFISSARGNNFTPPQTKLRGLNMAMLKSIPRGGVGNVAKLDQQALTDKIKNSKTTKDIIKYTLEAIYALSYTLPKKEYAKTGANKYQKFVLFVAGTFQFAAALNAVALRLGTGYDKDRYYDRVGLVQRSFRKESFNEMEYVQHAEIERMFNSRWVKGKSVLGVGVGVLGIIANLISTSPFKQAFESDALFAQQFVGETIAKFIELFAGRDKKKKAFEALFAAARSTPQIAAMLGYPIPGLGSFIGATQSVGKGGGLAKVLWSDTSAQVLDGVKNLKSIVEAGKLVVEEHTGEAGANLGKAVGQLWLDYFLNGTKAYDKHAFSTVLELFENYGAGGVGGWSPLGMMNDSIEKNNQRLKEEAGQLSSTTIDINDGQPGDNKIQRTPTKILYATTLGDAVGAIGRNPHNHKMIQEFLYGLEEARSRPGNSPAEKVLFDRLAQALPTDYLTSDNGKPPSVKVIEKHCEKLEAACGLFLKQRAGLNPTYEKLLGQVKKLDLIFDNSQNLTNKDELMTACQDISDDIWKLESDFERFYILNTGINLTIVDQVNHLNKVKDLLSKAMADPADKDKIIQDLLAAKDAAGTKPKSREQDEKTEVRIDIKDKPPQTSQEELSSPSGTAPLTLQTGPMGIQSQLDKVEIPVLTPILEHADDEKPLNLSRDRVPTPPPRKNSTSVVKNENDSGTPLILGGGKGNDSNSIAALIAIKRRESRGAVGDTQIELQSLSPSSPENNTLPSNPV